MKSKNIFLFCILFCTVNSFYAQSTDSSSKKRQRNSIKDKLSFNIGGNVLFGTVTNISIMPQIGYKLTDQWIAGVGGNFQYYQNSLYSNAPFMIYGGNLFTRYHFTPELFAQTEYQLLQFNGYLGQYGLIGGGYVSQAGVYLSAYYIFARPTNNSVYSRPYTIRLGYFF